MSQTDLLAKASNVNTSRHIASALRGNIRSIDAALQHIFRGPQEETRTQKARQLMGAEISNLPDEELEIYLTEFQYLIDSWLDTYEQEVYAGLTLKEMLGSG